MTRSHRAFSHLLAVIAGVVIGFVAAEVRHGRAVRTAPASTTASGSSEPSAGASRQRSRSADASKQPTGFQGLPFGASERDVKAKFRDVTCSRGVGEPLNYCFASTDIADEWVQVTFTFADGKFVEAYATFPPRAWGKVRAVMTQRFGSPTYSDVVTVQTPMNATFDNERLVWSWPTVKVQAARFADKIDKGEMRIMLRSWADRQNASERQSITDAARTF